MSLLFLESVGNALSKGFWGIREGGEGVGHDFDCEELVAGKAVEADGPIFLNAVILKVGEFLFFRPFIETHSDRTNRLIKNERFAWKFIS